MIINLRDFYPHLQCDCFEDVPDEIVEQLRVYKGNDATEARKKREKSRIALSLDYEKSRVGAALFLIDISPEAIYEKKLSSEQLYGALSRLHPKQRDRVYAHFILGYKITEIARMEEVSPTVVSIAIKKGLKHIREMLNV